MVLACVTAKPAASRKALPVHNLFEVTDDSGLLAIIDPDTYTGYIAENWQLDQLTDLFKAQMDARQLLIWGTDMENIWRVHVVYEPTLIAGFREVTGYIRSTSGSLLLSSFDSLSMAAQYPVSLPEDHELNLLMTVEPRLYRCRIIQLQSHVYGEQGYDLMDDAEAHYIVELLPAQTADPAWKFIPWSDIED